MESNLWTRRDQIMEKVRKNTEVCELTGCWNWRGGTSGTGRGGGYGRMNLDGHTVAVHIAVFTNCFGLVPGNKQIDHICENRLCCNPDHLDLVTHLENQRRKKHRALKLECTNV